MQSASVVVDDIRDAELRSDVPEMKLVKLVRRYTCVAAVLRAKVLACLSLVPLLLRTMDASEDRKSYLAQARLKQVLYLRRRVSEGVTYFLHVRIMETRCKVRAFGHCGSALCWVVPER